MNTTLQPTADNSFTLNFTSLLDKINAEDWLAFFRLNAEWHIELTREGNLIIQPLAGGMHAARSFRLAGLFGAWVQTDDTGIGFCASTMFALPNGAKRSPDLAWVKRSRWQALSDDERRGFPPLCPDFVVELRSHTDSLRVLQDKMREYLAGGAQLGWLIDPIEKKVYAYRPGADTECLDHPASISGEPLLAGFTLELAEVW